jgi:integrase
MLDLKLRGSIYYICGFHKGKRIRQTAKTKDKCVAEGIRVKMEHDLLFGRAPSGDNGKTFSDAVGGYLKRRAHTSDTTSDYLVRFMGEWDKMGVQQIDQTFLEEWLDARLDSVKPQTVRREINAFMPVLRHARKRGWIDEVPDIERPADGEPRLRVLNEEEYSAVMNNHEEGNYGSGMARFLLHTGARIGEAVKLRFEDVHTGEHPYLTLRTRKRKGGKEATRDIPINPVVLTYGEDVYGPSSDWPKSGRVWSIWDDQRAAGKAVMRYVHGLGIDDFRPHDLRRTFATRLLLAGADMRSVADLLGHTSLAMVMRYAVPPNNHKRDLVNSLGV